MTEATLVTGTQDVGDEVRRALVPMMEELKGLLDGMRLASTSRTDPETHLQLGKALTVSMRWEEAAEQFEIYLRTYPDNWEVHFLHGTVLANRRRGDSSNQASLRAYNEAIALAPQDTDRNLRARLHTYRGAMLKRLGRLDEAESDFLLARRWATADYERFDLSYNLATLSALRASKLSMLDYLAEVPPKHRRHLGSNPYFKAFWDDVDFLELVHEESF